MGLSEGKLIFIIRKRTPISLMHKTIVDTASEMLLNVEIVEGADKYT